MFDRILSKMIFFEYEVSVILFRRSYCKKNNGKKINLDAWFINVLICTDPRDTRYKCDQRYNCSRATAIIGTPPQGRWHSPMAVSDRSAVVVWSTCRVLIGWNMTLHIPRPVRGVHCGTAAVHGSTYYCSRHSFHGWPF